VSRNYWSAAIRRGTYAVYGEIDRYGHTACDGESVGPFEYQLHPPGLKAYGVLWQPSCKGGDRYGSKGCHKGDDEERFDERECSFHELCIGSSGTELRRKTRQNFADAKFCHKRCSRTVHLRSKIQH
jgi:hypothetical protein